jgi:hypothetical protein
MSIVASPSSVKVTLTGDVQMKGSRGSQAGTVSVDRLVLNLNANYELVSWSAGGS